MDVEDDLARTQIDITRSARQASVEEEGRLSALLIAKARASTTMNEAKFRMDVASKFLGMSGVDIVSSTLAAEFDLVVVVHRNMDGKVVKKPVVMDSTLLPGDTLEVAFQELGSTLATQ